MLADVSMHYHDTLDWPLSEEWLARYSIVHSKYVQRLLSDEGDAQSISRERCERLIARLEEQRLIEIERMIDLIPSPSQLREVALKERRNRNAETIDLYSAKIKGLQKRLRNLPKDIPRERDELEILFKRQVKDYADPQLPSFVSHLERELAARRLGKSGQAVGGEISSFMRSVFKPEMLMKIAKLLPA